MKAMTLRNLDPAVAGVLRERARSEGRSLNSLICEILAREAGECERRARMREQRPLADALSDELRQRRGEGSDSADLVREDRDR